MMNNQLYDLTHKRIVFTGQLASLTRQQAFLLAKALGALPQRNSSENLDYVIAGVINKSFATELTTKKLIFAQKHSITIISERDFLIWVIRKIEHLKNFIN
ncbi:BRCT domain-containing protein [Bombilactobacillus bombi]|uniref:BRCT domain-containing protein n=1 Tax=Bombilactobacillus bombi TaxID=1303590 RepID=UPI0035E4E7AF